MRVLVTSDTHESDYYALPEQFRDEIRLADAIIHAGDFATYQLYNDFLLRTTGLYAVQGNNDYFPVAEERVFTLEKVKIALIHSHQATGDTINWLVDHFNSEKPQIIIYGHTHNPVYIERNGIALLNPGSPTRNRGVFYNSYAILNINESDFNISMIPL